MKTKSGKSHFTCEFRTYDAAGNLRYENVNHKFLAANLEGYLAWASAPYIANGMTVEFKNVVNLDAE